MSLTIEGGLESHLPPPPLSLKSPTGIPESNSPAINPENWRSGKKTGEEITTDAAYYATENGHSPEQLGEKGLFWIGYRYWTDLKERKVYPLTLNGEKIPQDVRSVLDTTTPQGRKEKENFERVVETFLRVPDGSLVIWVSPAGHQYPYPRIYLAQMGITNPQGERKINALDFNVDFSPGTLWRLLKTMDPSLNPPQENEEQLAKEVIVLLPQDNQPRQPAEILTALEKIGCRQIHGVSLEIVARQLKERAWEEILQTNLTIAQKMKLAQRIKEARSEQEALWVIAQFEAQLMLSSGAVFGPSSCGSAVGGGVLLNPHRTFPGLPVSMGTVNHESLSRCPHCGHRFCCPLKKGSRCPYCGQKI